MEEYVDTRPLSGRALQLRKLSAVENFPHIRGFKGKLYKFQEVGVAYALAMKTAMIADVTGVGKTIQVLALMQYLAEHNDLYPAVIMAPASILRQWQREAHKFTELKPVIIRGTKYERSLKLARRPNLVLVNYELFVRYPEMLEMYSNLRLLVCDEASAFKNPEAKTKAAVLEFSKRCERVIPMTATPVQTSLLDMWSVMQTLRIPNYPTQEEFEGEHIKSVLIDMVHQGRRFKFKKVLGYKDLPGARALFAPWFIRRKLDEIDAELPNVIWKEERLDLDDDHMKEYRRIVSVGSFNIMQLQQYIDLARVGASTRSAKIDRVMELLTGELFGQKVIVYSYFKHSIAEIARRLHEVRMPNGKKGMSHIIVTGDVTGPRREADIERFQTDVNCRVCVGDGAMEKGLNLQVASYMILIDQFSNPKRTEQLIGRFRRIGGHSTIIAIPLIAADTHEEAILGMVREREALASYMMHEGSELYPDLTPDAIRKLLKL